MTEGFLGGCCPSGAKGGLSTRPLALSRNDDREAMTRNEQWPDTMHMHVHGCKCRIALHNASLQNSVVHRVLAVGKVTEVQHRLVNWGIVEQRGHFRGSNWPESKKLRETGDVEKRVASEAAGKLVRWRQWR